MPIIYAVESWLALRYTEQRIYLETLRDLYEAYVRSCEPCHRAVPTDAAFPQPLGRCSIRS